MKKLREIIEALGMKTIIRKTHKQIQKEHKMKAQITYQLKLEI